MKFNHTSASNLFLRLTSLAAEEGSDRVENFCTETLAWCLINSKTLRKFFLLKVKLASPYEHIEFDTQQLCRIQKDVRRASKVRQRAFFDLVVTCDRNEPTMQVFIIEVKVSSGFGKDQLEIYKEAAKREYHGSTLKVKVGTLTPYLKPPHGADFHIRWGEIQEALRKAQRDESL